jgi:hypothetical protein
MGNSGGIGPTGPTGASGGGGSGALHSISVTIASGTTDWGASPPSGWVTNTTNRVLVTPTDDTSTLIGMPACNDGFQVRVIVVSSSLSVDYENASAGTPANNFLTSGAGTVTAIPQKGITWEYVGASTGWMAV